MPRTQTFIRSRGDARAVAAAHRSHRGTPHFGCPLCIHQGARVHRSR